MDIFSCAPNGIFYSRVILSFLFIGLRLKKKISCEKSGTQHTNKITKQYFLGFGYKVNVRFNFCSQQAQGGMLVSSAIPFVSLFIHVIIEKALSLRTNMGSTFSVQSFINAGNCPVGPHGCRLVTLQLFQNCFPRIFVVFPMCFLAFGTVMVFISKLFPFGTDITCNLTRHCGLPLLLVKKYLSFQLELNFVFLSHFSFDNHFL